MECKGLCAGACGPIDMSAGERSLLRFRGVNVPSPLEALEQLAITGDYSCPALVDGRCSVYDVRPTICRLYGASEDFRCEHGCMPVGGFLTAAEGRSILAESLS
jgi:Fe-S-cluster containining protein